MNEYENIVKKCEDLGISISELCRNANVNRSILARWKNQTPKSIEILNKLNNELKKIKDEQNDYNG